MTNHTLLPEWSATRAVLLAWPYPHGDWRSNYAQVEQCYWGILQSLTQHTDVWLLYHISLSADDFINECHNRGVNRERVTLFPETYNDTWVRDYGPLSTSQGLLKFQFNGWGGKYHSADDNRAVKNLLHANGLSCREVDFVCEGGALETNGRYLLMNSSCVVDEARNPGLKLSDVESVLTHHLRNLRPIWLHDICLTGDDTDGHIDTIARFASPERIVYAGPNTRHRDSDVLDSLQSQIEVLAADCGLDLVALPSPEFYSDIDGRLLPCTYANFLICNSVVFAPVYGISSDALALDTLRRAFPYKHVVPVRCEALLEQHGSLHCATMQVAEQSTVEGEQ